MDQIRLPKNFLNNNPLKDISAAMFTYFRMATITMSEMNETINQIVVPRMEESRHEDCMAEKEYIMNIKDAEDVVSYMRKIKDPSNTSLLIQKAIAYQDDVMPLVLKRICRSGYAVFIENAAILTANVDMKYTEQLYDVFPDIRNTYARSELCIVFGVKRKAEYTQLLMDQFKRIKEERPDQDYEQGPLLALHLIYGKVW